MSAALPVDVGSALREGVVIPAHPLALDATGRLDERRQRALSRYYLEAGAGGLAVGVHTTQFAIREAGLLEPVLRIAADTVREAPRDRPVVLVAGVSGTTDQAVAEAKLAADHGYHLAMVILRGLAELTDDELIAHIAAVGEVLPVFGFYLQPAVGGRTLGYDFWARLAELPCLAAIKIAPFDRYRTLDVVRAVCESSRAAEIALYTGNDDNIIVDLLTTYRFPVNGGHVSKRIVGGLLGQYAVWTHRAVELFERAREAARTGQLDEELLTTAATLTDANAAVFDVAHGFAGCVAGIHEVLRRQGLLDNVRLLDEQERLSPGQAAELDRVIGAYPDLQDDAFVAAHLDRWLDT
ncbi:dihydrodipicolinate synthase family protein [Micromonospora sp. DR5-3]|uniref:dihydrodipicolinate synthase family protein n=1 Tax=unclassified Micromonospora TaxID=2617518 RepID=UPI0011D37A1A|nr:MULTISPECIES: dihydrodipicolinate synthase family protein [unclassified Micromonospora]MCW3814368.1 dihydrodipicolinate synthase family protein [Micromonospora sp. DR5-3]TYC22442.1 dihydrodipicolinate synthase family protein [Micromonospora sp. MP36]